MLSNKPKIECLVNCICPTNPLDLFELSYYFQSKLKSENLIRLVTTKNRNEYLK